MKLLQYIRKAFNWLTRPERFSLINTYTYDYGLSGRTTMLRATFKL